MFKLSSMLLVIALASNGCASTGKSVAQLEPGMTKQQVLGVLGSPADRLLPWNR
jgi:outer membrane protein assembly factor BamE (lipoprotein component of BamABCDE complex)